MQDDVIQVNVLNINRIPLVPIRYNNTLMSLSDNCYLYSKYQIEVATIIYPTTLIFKFRI